MIIFFEGHEANKILFARKKGYYENKEEMTFRYPITAHW